MSKNTKQNIKVENNTQEKKVKIHRNNYWKYDEVKAPLRSCLEKDMTTAEISKAVGISQMTTHKYKAMLSLEDGKLYQTRDERVYLKIKTENKVNGYEKQ